MTTDELQSATSWSLKFDSKVYWWDEPTISGADIKKLVQAPATYQLYQEIGPHWWNRKPISDSTAVDLRTEEARGSEFYVAPPAYGG